MIALKSITSLRACFSLLLLLIISSPSLALAPFEINDSFTRHALGTHLEYFEDTTDSLTIAEISSPDYKSKFIASGREYPSFGFSRNPYWLRLAVRNTTDLISHWILEYNYPIIDLVEAYIPAGTQYKKYVAGDSVPFDQWVINYRSIAFPITQQPGDLNIYLRIKSSGSLTVPLNALSRDAFSAGIQTEMALLFLHYGIMAAIALYSLFIFVSTGGRSYLHLFLFTSSIAVYSMIHNGLAFQFLWPRSLWWANISNPFSLFMAVIWALQFTRSFLSLKESAPRLDRIFRYCIISHIPILVSPFFIDYFFATQLSTLSSGIAILMIVITGSFLLVKGNRAARFFMLAWTLFIVGAALTALRAYGIVPSGLFTMWGYQFGSSLMVILLSFGIADQMNMLRRDREKAITALGESEEKYRILVENAREGILLIIDEKPYYANRSLMEMTGYSEDEFYKINVFDHFFPDTPNGRDLVRARYTARLNGEDAPTQYESQIINRNGEIIDIFISAAIITIEGRKGSLSIITNITSIKNAEKTILHQYEEIQSQYEELEALNEELVNTQNELLDSNDSLTREREKLAITLRSIADAVITTDTDGKITFMNGNAEALMDISFPKSEGALFSDIVSLNEYPGGISREDPVNTVLTYGRISGRDMILHRKSRKPHAVIVALNGAPLKNRAGDVTGVVLVMRDVTSRVKLELELQKMNRLESLGVLAGGIAHDFNNLLTAILANTSLLKVRCGDDEKTQRMFTLMERAGERAVGLTRQLLTFSKGGDPVRKTAFIAPLLRESIDITLTGSSVRCELIFESDEDSLWPLEVDPGQISQVFNNILINAIQAMPDGGLLRIRVRNCENTPENIPIRPGNYVQVSFADTGAGIPESDMEKIFDPYYTTKKNGYGLGLATSYSIIKKHGGFIQVESSRNSGSTFTVFLLSSSTVREPEKPVSHIPDVRESLRILIMDDEDFILDSMSGIIERLGYRYSTARDGREAIESFREAAPGPDPFDAVIMDLTIPGGMGGREAVTEMRKVNTGAFFIVSSGYSQDPVLANYREYGFDGVINKPYRLTDVTLAIESALSQRKNR